MILSATQNWFYNTAFHVPFIFSKQIGICDNSEHTAYQIAAIHWMYVWVVEVDVSFDSPSKRKSISLAYSGWLHDITKWLRATIVLENAVHKIHLVKRYLNIFTNDFATVLTDCYNSKSSVYCIDTYLFLTAWRGEDSCGNKAAKIVVWKLISRPPNLDNKSAKISSASSCTDTSSCFRPTVKQ